MATKQDQFDADVVILGAGPVGLTVANLLGQRGIRVIQLEAGDAIIDYPRAVGVDDEAMRVMQTVGLVDKVLPHTSPDQKITMVNEAGTIIGEVNPTTREYGWPRRNSFIQPLVDEVLLDGLARFETVEFRFGCEATEVAQDADSATVTYKDAGGTKTLRAKYIVASNGGTSFVRKSLGISFEGVTRKNPGLVIDVADDPLGTPNAVFGGDPTRPWATLSLPHGVRRWEFTMLDGEPDSLADNDDFIFGLLADFVPDPKTLKIIRRRVYTFNARVAGKYHVGRILLAGDAAHLMPVVAGQGWNSGMRDAINLGWKLAAVVLGEADEALLDTYDSERIPHVTQIVALSQSMANEMTDLDPNSTHKRDEAAAHRTPEERAAQEAQAYKPLPKYEGVVVHTKTPTFKGLPDREAPRLTGQLFPQPLVVTADGFEELLDDATGQGWRIVVWNNNPTHFLSEATGAKLRAIKAKLVRVVPAVEVPWAVDNTTPAVTVVGDPDGSVKAWFDQRPFSCFIVRPDHIVAAECLAEDLDATVAKVLEVAHIK